MDNEFDRFDRRRVEAWRRYCLRCDMSPKMEALYHAIYLHEVELAYRDFLAKVSQKEKPSENLLNFNPWRLTDDPRSVR